jgi:hypothetical protein
MGNFPTRGGAVAKSSMPKFTLRLCKIAGAEELNNFKHLLGEDC